MDDFSLEDLQAALLEVQEHKSATRLNERNVVELVNKLRELGFLGDDLLHSISGKEYVTASQLCSEVEKLVKNGDGRVAVVELPGLLGVDITHCERQAQEAVRLSEGSLQLIQGEIISDAYFGTVAKEIDKSLQELGVTALSEIARKFKLSADIVQSIISDNLGAIIHGRVDSGILYTDRYISQLKTQLKAALGDAVHPINLVTLIKEWNLQTTSSTAKTLTSLTEELINEAGISGTLQPGTSIFTPSAHAENQQKAAEDFYNQNSYIEYSMLERLGISNGRSHMAANFPDGMILESVFVGPQLQAQLDAALEEALSGNSWLDVQTALPAAISASDASTLLSKSLNAQSLAVPSQGVKPQVFAGTCLVSGGLLEDLKQRSCAHAQEAAAAELHGRRASASSAGPATSIATGEKSGQKKSAAPTIDADSDDDWDLKGKKKKGGRRKGGAKGKSGPAANAAGKAGKSKAGPDAEHVASEVLSTEALTGKVLEWLPETEGAGEAGDLAETLAAFLRPAALEEYEKAIAAVFLAGAEARRRQRESLGKLLEESWHRLQLYAKGAELAEGDEATHLTLQRHLTRGLGQQILDFILLYQEVEARSDQSADAGQTTTAPLPPTERAAIIKTLPADTKPSALAAEKALNGSDLTAVIEALQEAAGAAGVALRRLDKKTEKAMVQEHRAALEEKLQGQEDPAEALTLAVPLLITQVHKVAMSIPGKALAGAIALLKDGLDPDAFQQLSDFHQLVVQSLKSQSMSPQLAALLPAVKRLACKGLDAERH